MDFKVINLLQTGWLVQTSRHPGVNVLKHAHIL
jgi:hypothetical protein